MSEYQYDEFAAVDEPLTDKQLGELRRISTRAETLGELLPIRTALLEGSFARLYLA